MPKCMTIFYLWGQQKRSDGWRTVYQRTGSNRLYTSQEARSEYGKMACFDGDLSSRRYSADAARKGVNDEQA